MLLKPPPPFGGLRLSEMQQQVLPGYADWDGIYPTRQLLAFQGDVVQQQRDVRTAEIPPDRLAVMQRVRGQVLDQLRSARRRDDVQERDLGRLSRDRDAHQWPTPLAERVPTVFQHDIRGERSRLELGSGRRGELDRSHILQPDIDGAREVLQNSRVQRLGRGI
jgi:hypothetical protein